MLVNPIIVDQKSQQQLVSEGLIFAGFINNSLLISIDQKIRRSSNQLSEFIEKIDEINRANGLFILEPFHRHGTPGAYGIKLVPNFSIVYMIINSFTDIVSHTPRFEFDGKYQLFHCTALDVIYLLGFSSDLAEIIDFIRYDTSEQAQIFSFGGKSSLFFAWKRSNRLISSGAIEFNHLFLSYNQAEEYTYSHFKDYLCEFPQNGSTLFNDPLNWNLEKSDLGYNRIYHKGCKGFGGEIKAIGCNTYAFLAHNIEFFTKEDFSNEAHTALKTVDELNQRLIIRYADFINNICILKGKTLQFLYMPWHYAKQHYSQDFLSNTSRKIVFSDEFIDQDSVIIRYSVDPNIFLSLLETATNREAENTYFAELLQPLQKYSPNQFKLLYDQLTKDSALKKTVGVFQIKQLYYFSDMAFDVDISAISLAKVRKCIAKVCRESGVKPGEYHGQEATKVIRTMQRSIVQVFENYISSLDKFHLHNLALGYYATQENGVILNKKRYAAFADFDEEIQLELKQKTRDIREEYRGNVRTAEYLLESNLAITHLNDARKCSKDEFNFLLAFADWLVALQDNADTCHYTDFDLSISIDSEYKVDTLLSESARQSYDTLLLRKYSSSEYQMKDDSIDLEFFNKAINTFKQDTNIKLDLLVSLLSYMLSDIVQDGTATEIYPNVFEVEKSTLEKNFNEKLVDKISDPHKISDVVDFLTLDPSGLKTVKNEQCDILPIWEREKRDNRFSVKPIVMHGNKCIFSPVAMDNVLTSWRSGITEWYLPYEIGLPNLQTILKQWKKRYEDEMVQDIAQLFRSAKYDIVVTEVDLAHRFPQDGYPSGLGDYDIIAISKSEQTIWIIESKVLQKVGSIFEDQMQQKSFFFQHKDDEKFQRRINYMSENTSKVLKSFDINNNGYQLISYMVTNKLFASRYKKVAFPIITYNELQEILGNASSI